MENVWSTVYNTECYLTVDYEMGMSAELCKGDDNLRVSLPLFLHTIVSLETSGGSNQC